jgi:hypothetical protein
MGSDLTIDILTDSYFISKPKGNLRSTYKSDPTKRAPLKNEPGFAYSIRRWKEN